jgi:peptidoglycan/xylan/chitin deacetylase (PgdA/CDA1 family)
MRVCFTFHARAERIPEVRHAIATVASLLEYPSRLAAPGERATSSEVPVFIGPPESAPEDAAAVIALGDWRAWAPGSVRLAHLDDRPLLVTAESAAQAATDRELPEAWLRGLAFLLGREEEFSEPYRDEWGCFNGFSSRLHELGVLDVPLVNQYAAALERRIRDWAEHRHRALPSRPRWKNRAHFAVVLSHDVDWIRRWSLPQSLRLLSRSGLTSSYALRKGVSSALDALLHLGATADPYCTFDRWLAAETLYGFASSFYFCVPDPRPRHPYDPTYAWSDPVRFEGRAMTCEEMMRLIAERGFEVGLHGGYHSHHNAAELAHEKRQVEDALGAPIEGLRQHYLRFDVRRTWRAQEIAGFTYDSTLGYNEAIGFRAGIAAPFHPWNAAERAPHRLLELPMTAMDGTLFRTLKLSGALAARRVREHLEAVEAAGGLAVLLWHPNATDTAALPGWWECYRETLAYLATRPAWVTHARDVASWWREREADEARAG